MFEEMQITIISGTSSFKTPVSWTYTPPEHFSVCWECEKQDSTISYYLDLF